MNENRVNPEEPALESFASGENRDLAQWRWLWEQDKEFPISSHRGFLGRVIVLAKKILRKIVRAPQADLWDRQRRYNLLIQEQIERIEPMLTESDRQRAGLDQLRSALESLGADLQQVQQELVRDVRLAREAQERELGDLAEGLREELYSLQQEHWKYLQDQHGRVKVLEGFHNDGWDEVMDHTAALFARVDQKLDRYRELSRERWGRLGSLLQVAEEGSSKALARAVDEEKYVEFEGLFRGEEGEIGPRLKPYLEILAGRGEVLDLGCGRGEALAVFSENGIPCRGVDASSEMIERCRAKGMSAEVDDLFSALDRTDAGTLGGVVSFHVIEHLDPPAHERLVRAAWRVLKPGGVLILETPSPLSVIVGARNFWIDPTHRRPVHPESLKALFELNGYDPVERIDLQPFPADKRLPEIELAELLEELWPLAKRINAMRDQLDGLLYGYQDYGLVGYKPA